MANDAIKDFEAQLVADVTPSRTPQSDAQLAARIEARSIAGKNAASALAARPIPEEQARQWAQLDAQDIAHIQDKHTARLSLADINDNRSTSAHYDAALAANYKTVRDAADYAADQERVLVNAKEGRKRRDAAAMGFAVGRATSTPTGASQLAANVAEENRARLEAWRELSRDRAVSGFPSLKSAYELRDASAAFAAAHIGDKASAVAFAQLTEEFIERRLARNERLPDVAKVRRERDRLAERERDTLESHRLRESEIER